MSRNTSKLKEPRWWWAPQRQRRRLRNLYPFSFFFSLFTKLFSLSVFFSSSFSLLINYTHTHIYIYIYIYIYLYMYVDTEFTFLWISQRIINLLKLEMFYQKNRINGKCFLYQFLGPRSYIYSKVPILKRRYT